MTFTHTHTQERHENGKVALTSLLKIVLPSTTIDDCLDYDYWFVIDGKNDDENMFAVLLNSKNVHVISIVL